MIAVDSSSLIAYLNGESTADTELVDHTLQEGIMVLPPVVLTEVLSFPNLPTGVADLLGQIPISDILDGYWERAGAFRAGLLADGRKARLADTLIATSCIDHDTVLVTRDTDFRQFERYGLRLTGLT